MSTARRRSRFRISRSQLDDIFAHARREAPDVCCGAVFGRDGKVTAVHPLENVAASPFRFEVEGASLLDLMDKVDDEDALVAWYCSRTRAPQGPPYPSQTDVQFAAGWPGVQWLIVQVPEDAAPEARSYLIEDETIWEVAIEVT